VTKSQLARVRRQYPGRIVLVVRDGFVYAFEDDVEFVVALCGTAKVTWVSVSGDTPRPLTGFPKRRLVEHELKLIAAGHKVLIVEE
jgi:DNA mismatch repair ATPase MutS